MAEPLAPWVQRELATSLSNCRAVAGGCIHSAWALELDDGRRLFAKTNSAAALPVLAAEAEGLRALAPLADGELVVPAPLFCGLEQGRALLVMEWLELAPGGPQDRWRRLGAALARLHRRSLDQGQAQFGWNHDNFIGAGVQVNGWDSEWGRFFAERRLGPQLQRLQERNSNLAARLAAPIGQLLMRVPGWLNRHGARPSLVHGDLWSGNASLLAGDRAALFDPAVHWGDREVDLAMARLFGGFPEPFFLGYGDEWPLPAGHDQRATLYNLYHLLNHANLFGGGYGDQVERCARELLAVVPAAAA
jgi:fructosamine-3-kinase